MCFPVFVKGQTPVGGAVTLPKELDAKVFVATRMRTLSASSHHTPKVVPVDVFSIVFV